MAVTKITNAEYQNLATGSGKPIVLDFYADWCGPCRMMGPVIEELANESDGSYKVGKINVDDEIELASSYKVMSIPMLAVFKNGAIAEGSVGARPKEEVIEMINRAK